MCTMPLTDAKGRPIVRQTAAESAANVPSQLKSTKKANVLNPAPDFIKPK
jgi:hypothetical protein